MSEIGIATNKKLIELFNLMKSGNLILRPRFQRNLVWNYKHKEKFIETILKGLPFPEIYLADGEIDLEKQTSTSLVVDGQQRLGTIYEYITKPDEFRVTNIKRFNELEDNEKKSFFDYKIVVRDLGRISEELILDIFNRINSVQYALNSMEVRNALYQGEFIQVAKTLMEVNKEFFKKIEVFSDEESSRMDDTEFMLLVISTIEEGGYFAGKKEIETYVKLYDEEYPNKENTIRFINYALSLIRDCNLSIDTIWYKKSNFFSLLVELALYNMYTGTSVDINALSNLLKELEEKIYDNKKGNNEFSQYYSYIFQSTQSRKGREVRGKLIRKNLAQLKIKTKLHQVINDNFIDLVCDKASNIITNGTFLGSIYGDFGLPFDYLDFDYVDDVRVSDIEKEQKGEDIQYNGKIEIFVYISPGTHYAGERVNWSGVEILLGGKFSILWSNDDENYKDFVISDLVYLKRYHDEKEDYITDIEE